MNTQALFAKKTPIVRVQEEISALLTLACLGMVALLAAVTVELFERFVGMESDLFTFSTMPLFLGVPIAGLLAADLSLQTYHSQH